MSFAAPLFLLGLLAVPLAALAYVRFERTRRAAVAAFAAPAVLGSVAPRRPGWRRHAPLVFFAVALAVLIVALAKPQRTIAVPVERASIMLATDYSGSMQATDVAPTRLVAARAAADRFLRQVPAKIRVGLVAFNQSPRVLSPPTTDRDAIRTGLASLTPQGGTASGEAVLAALDTLQRQSEKEGAPVPGAIVLLSDGKSTHGTLPATAAQRARAKHVPIYTVALGTATGTISVRQKNGTVKLEHVPPDPDTMRQIAAISRGKAFTAADASSLSAVYKQLGSSVARRKGKQELTAGFAGGALALLAAGALMSLYWFRRLI